MTQSIRESIEAMVTEIRDFRAKPTLELVSSAEYARRERSLTPQTAAALAEYAAKKRATLIRVEPLELEGPALDLLAYVHACFAKGIDEQARADNADASGEFS